MKSDQKKVLVVAQEITFAKALSSNDKFLRERALRRLKKWLLAKSHLSEDFTEEGFMRLWKGLFYCIWMSDKPLVQEDNVEEVSNLLHCFTDFNDCQKFSRCFFQAMSQAWFGLDQHRLDKFMMLVRRFLRHNFEAVSRRGWSVVHVKGFSEDLFNALRMAPVGMNLHLIEIYFEELAKVGQGTLRPELVLSFLTPFARFMAESSDTRVISHITKHIFLYLMRQSDEGIKERVKFKAWKERGFPGGVIDVMEEVSEPSDEEEQSDSESQGEVDEDLNEEPLDPRAGRVDVFLPNLPFEPNRVIQLLNEFRFKKTSTTKARKSFTSLIEKFKKLESGTYPLGLKRVEVPENDEEEDVEEAAESFLNWEISELKDSIKNRGKNWEKVGSDWEITPITSVLKLQKTPDVVLPPGEWEVTTIEKKSPKKLKRKSSAVAQRRSVKKSRGSGFKSEQNCYSTEDIKAIEAVDRTEPNDNSGTIVSSDEKTKGKRRKKKIGQPLGAPKPDETSHWGQNDWDNNLKKNETKPHKMKKIFPKERLSLSSPGSKTLVKGGQQKFNSSFHCLGQSPCVSTPGSAKKVAFSLRHNTTQGENEYKQTLKKRPSIPFDADKKPNQGVLKPTPVNSPINPFYRTKLNRRSLQ